MELRHGATGSAPSDGERAFLRGILDGLDEGVYYVDSERRVTYWNTSAERISGFTSGEVVGRPCWGNILCHLDERGIPMCHGGCALSTAMADGSPVETVAYLHHKVGHRVRVRIRVLAIRNPEGQVIGAAQIFSDDFSREEASLRIGELEKMAYLDELTGVANRRFLEISLQMAASEMQRYGWPFGIVLMDLDGFKSVNDTHGHCAGDELLRVVAKTLAGNSRPSDVIGRWGGDEFLAVVKNADEKQLQTVAEKYVALVGCSSLGGPGRGVRVSLSAGVAVASAEDTPLSLIVRADQHMYRNKAGTRLPGSQAATAPAEAPDLEGERAT